MTAIVTVKRKRPRAAAMSPAELRRLIAASRRTITDAAEVLQVARQTVTRWLNGSTPIGRAQAALARQLLK